MPFSFVFIYDTSPKHRIFYLTLFCRLQDIFGTNPTFPFIDSIVVLLISCLQKNIVFYKQINQYDIQTEDELFIRASNKQLLVIYEREKNDAQHHFTSLNCMILSRSDAPTLRVPIVKGLNIFLQIKLLTLGCF